MHTGLWWLLGRFLLAVPAISASAITDAPCTAGNEEILQLLKSHDWEDHLRAYECLEKRERLQPELLQAAVEALKYEDPPGSRLRPGGPDTAATPLTRVLVEHKAETLPLLVERLSDPRWQVRRYAAFCVGEIGDRRVLPELRSALMGEIQRARKTRIQVDGNKPDFMMAALRAMVQAYAKIDCREATELLLSLFTVRGSSFRNYVASYGLSLLFPGSPANRPGNHREWTAESGKRWREWWRQNPATPCPAHGADASMLGGGGWGQVT